MTEVETTDESNEPAWRQRAVSRSLNAARSRAEQRVQRFLDAAFSLIDEKGTTEFTIQEVIDRSKQSLRGFYQYFNGKDELLLALFEETVPRSNRRSAQCHRVDIGTHRAAARVHRPVARVVRSVGEAAEAFHAQSPADHGVLGPAHRRPFRAREGRDGAHLPDDARARRGRKRGRCDRCGRRPPRRRAHAADGHVQLVRKPPGRERALRLGAEATWEFCLRGLGG